MLLDQLTEAELWNGKHVVWQNGEYFIAVDDPTDATYVTLWTVDNRRVGSLATRTHPTPEPYLGVSYIEIDKKHRNQGLGRQMYRALISHLGSQWKGISSYFPDRSNKQQVPDIWRKLGAYSPVDNLDYAFIDRTISE